MKKISKIALVSCVLLTPNLEIAAQAAKSPVIYKSGPCQVKVDNVHLSTSLAKIKENPYIKANADAYCNIKMDQMVVTVELWKEGTLADHKVETFEEFRSAIPIGKVVSNKSTSRQCNNSLISTYYAHAQVKGMSNGTTISSPWVKSPKPETICCGT